LGTESGIIRDGDLPGPHGFFWGFIALEYYALIANRVLAILETSHHVIVIRVGGLVVAPLHLTNAWYEPRFYVSDSLLAKYAPVAAESAEVLKVSRANRRIALSGITVVTFTTRPKWGMGSVPYSGRIIIATAASTREFILLGNQRGEELAAKLNSASAMAR